MTIRISRYTGLGLALLTAGGIAACANSDDTNTPGGGAGNSSAGAHTGGAGGGFVSGGAPGSAGNNTAGSNTAGSSAAGSGTAGTGTAGAGGAGAGYACAGTKPGSALITEFADLVANPASAGNYTFLSGVPGGTFSYQPAALTLATTGMALNVKGNVKAYDGFGVYLAACTDAAAYTGVSFNIKGNAGPTAMLSFRIQTNADTAVDAKNMKGICVVPAGTADTYPLCHAAAFDIPVATGGGVVSVKFSDVAAGIPVATVDGKDIVGFEWAFKWAGDTDTAYDADITLDDLKFTGGSSAGAGGSGGASAGAGGSAGTGGGAAGTGGTP